MHMSWGQNFHLHLTYLLSFGSLVNFHVPLAMGDSYSSCIAASYLLASWNLNTLHKSKGSLTNTILARCLVCWGRTCFFHHSLGGCRYFLGYLPFLPKSFNDVILRIYFDCLLICNQMIFHLLSSPLLHKSDLEDSSTTTIVGPSFLAFGLISKMFPMLVPSSMNATSLLLWFSKY